MKSYITLFCLLITANSFARIIPVGKTEIITSVKKGIASAGNGDTVLIHPGTYREGNIVIEKSIRLLGIGNPVLDGENKYEILTVSGNCIIVKGILFRNSGYSGMNDLASVSVINSKFCIIENNTIEHSFFGIHVANSSNCVIAGNNISGTPKTEQTSGNAIHLWKCDSMVIKENNASGHRDGIYFEFVTNSYILRNISRQNIRYGLHFMFSNNDTYMGNNFEENGAGVAVMYSHHVFMHGNLFIKNWGSNSYGILLKEISDARITNNKFLRNTVGILMESTNRIEVSSNEFRDNGWAVRIQASCNENKVNRNDFIANTFDVATNGDLVLNNFDDNFWDKYEGYDMNRDGIGDIAYHPVSMYSMVIEQNPNSLLFLRSFMVSLLDKAEKAIPSLTPELLLDRRPIMKKIIYDQN